MKIAIFVFLFFALSCNRDNKIHILFENSSDQHLDSTIIYFNDYPFTIKNIKPHSSLDTSILRSYINHNTHDVNIRVGIFNNKRIQFEGGTYYNDLSGSFDDQYEIIVNRNKKVVINTKK